MSCRVDFFNASCQLNVLFSSCLGGWLNCVSARLVVALQRAVVECFGCFVGYRGGSLVDCHGACHHAASGCSE